MAERALRSHADLQDRLSETLREHGLEPLSPGPGEPEFDIAWVVGGTMTVVELKSITEVNEVAQLRQGLGQVLHYRAELQRLYPSMNVKAALVVEREPGDPLWGDVCEQVDVELRSPQDLKSLIRTEPC